MLKSKKSSEPFLRIVRRDDLAWWRAWIIRGVSLLLSLVVCAAVIYAIVKMNPLEVYKTMFEGAFKTERKIWITVRDVMMLLCISVGLAPAFKMKFWNIGAEGQVLVGGIATVACMLYCKSLPTYLLFIVMIAASFAAGALWGFLPAIFKARFNTNETLFTLMMNYVATQLTSFFVAQWENPYGSNSVGIVNPNDNIGWFPSLFGQQYALNVIIVMTITVAMFFYLAKSKHGYEIAVVGDSERTAKYAGISVNKVILRTMLISGGICGLSGFIAVSGASHTISTTTAGGRGFTAIIVAWLSKFNAFVMIAVSLLLVFLQNGAREIATKYELNDYASQMITGIILFFILGSEFFINYRVILRGHSSKEI